jgi:hypothetical protein
VATDRSVLYVVMDGAASDGGTDGDPLAVQSEQLANIGVEVYVIGVGDRVRRCVFIFTSQAPSCGSNCVNSLENTWW